MNSIIKQLYAYNTWANACVLDHLKQLPETLCHKKIKSVFPTIFDVLAHIYIIDKGWHAVLTKQYRSDDYKAIKRSIDILIADTNGNSLAQLQNKQLYLARQMEEFIRTHSLEAVEILSGTPMSLSEIVQHIVNHGTYHRGNITAMLHQLGHKGVPTDYGLYLYMLRKDQ